MSYYQCPAKSIRQEADRRGLRPDERSEEKLSEDLMVDDHNRGSDATTVETKKFDGVMLQDRSLAYRTDPAQRTIASELVGQSRQP